MVNRYQDLLNAVPKGRLYEAAGEILPYRDSPHQLEFVTSKVNRTFQVFLNDVYSGETISDANGVAYVFTQARLESGDYEVRITDPTDDVSHRTAITIRKSATIHAALAEVLETLDNEIDLMDQARSIETVPSKYIQDVYGKRVRQSWPSTFLLDAYRNLLMQLWPAYRHFGGLRYGMDQVVEGYLSSSPLVAPRRWKPKWVPGEQATRFANTQERSRTSSVLYGPAGAIAGSEVEELPLINRQSRYYVHPEVTGVISGLSNFRQPPVPQRLTVTLPDANAVTLDGIDENGLPFSEIIPDPSITPAVGTWQSEKIFSSVTRAEKSAGTAAQIGLAESRFVKVVGINDYSPISAVLGLDYLGHSAGASPELQFQWYGGDVITFPLEGGEAQIKNPYLTPHVIGVVSTATTFSLNPLGSANSQDYHDRLLLDIDGLGPILIDIGLGATTATPTEVRDRINNAFAADTRYGAAYNTAAYLITGNLNFNETVIALRSPLNTEEASVLVLPGPCDAALSVFGFGRMSSRLSAPVSGTTIACISTDDMPDVSSLDPSPNRRRFDVRLRGKASGLLTGDVGSIAGSQGSIAPNPIGSYTFDASFVGGYVRVIDSIASQNDGLHRIIAFYDGFNSLGLLHEDALTGGVFAASGGAEFVVYHPGETITIDDNNETTDTLTSVVAAVQPWPTGALVDVKDDMPEAAQSRSGFITLDLEIDPDFRPVHDFGDSISMVGTTATLTSRRASFTVGMIGSEINIARAENLENEGTFTITARPSATQVEFTNAFGIDEVSEFEWSTNVLPASIGDTVTVFGSTLPDGWQFITADSIAVPGNVDNVNSLPGRTALSRLHIVSDNAGGVAFERNLPDLLDFRGLPLHVAFWLQEHSVDGETYEVSVSFDDGASYFSVVNYLGAQATPLNISTQRGPQDPFVLQGTFFVPHDATSCILRLSRTNTATLTGYGFSWEKVIVSSPTGTGLFCGSGTVPRSAKRALFGEMLYAWSPEEVTESEMLDLGLPLIAGSSLPTRPGHIDYASNAHGYWERAEVGERDTSVSPSVRQNLRGVYDDLDWVDVEANNRLTQLEIVPSVPGRLSYAQPTRISYVLAENLAMIDGGDGPGTARADLTLLSDHEGPFPQAPNERARLYEVLDVETTLPGPDGLTTVIPAGTPIPVPSSLDENGVQPWEFTSDQQIRVNSPYYNASATYRLDYDVLMRAETGPIQLSSAGVLPEDYVWLVDLATYKRFDVLDVLKGRTEQVVFDPSFQATLQDRADVAEEAELIQDSGSVSTVVSAQDWSFIDSKTIALNDPSIFDENSIYTLSYSARVPRVGSTVNFRVEWRSGATQVALDTAAWQEVSLHQPVTPVHGVGADVSLNNVHDWHQLRVTLSGVEDLRDVRVLGLGLRGLHMYGSSPNAPGITLPII